MSRGGRRAGGRSLPTRSVMTSCLPAGVELMVSGHRSEPLSVAKSFEEIRKGSCLRQRVVPSSRHKAHQDNRGRRASKVEAQALSGATGTDQHEARKLPARAVQLGGLHDVSKREEMKMTLAEPCLPTIFKQKEEPVVVGKADAEALFGSCDLVRGGWPGRHAQIVSGCTDLLGATVMTGGGSAGRVAGRQLTESRWCLPKPLRCRTTSVIPLTAQSGQPMCGRSPACVLGSREPAHRM
jgi:hypothetical protein